MLLSLATQLNIMVIEPPKNTHSNHISHLENHSNNILLIINLDDLDPSCALSGLVDNEAKKKAGGIEIILNNSFGMLGINSVLILKNFSG